MYKICKVLTKEMLCFQGGPHIALLQIEMTPLGPGLPSPTTLLFNCPIRGIMPIFNRPPHGEEDHEVIIKRQTKNDKDTSKSFVSNPIGSTVAVQWEDGGLWTHGTIEGKGDQSHHNRLYHIHITKTGRLVTPNRQHVNPIQTSAEQYLWDQPHKQTKADTQENILAQLQKQLVTSSNNSNR